jgi:hypothetical protein
LGTTATPKADSVGNSPEMTNPSSPIAKNTGQLCTTNTAR